MQATLTFSLPEERVSHLQAVHAGDLADAIVEADNTIRGWLKYGHEFSSPEAMLQELRSKFTEVISVARGEA